MGISRLQGDKRNSRIQARERQGQATKKSGGKLKKQGITNKNPAAEQKEQDRVNQKKIDDEYQSQISPH